MAGPSSSSSKTTVYVAVVYGITPDGKPKVQACSSQKAADQFVADNSTAASYSYVEKQTV